MSFRGVWFLFPMFFSLLLFSSALWFRVLECNLSCVDRLCFSPPSFCQTNHSVWDMVNGGGSYLILYAHGGRNTTITKDQSGIYGGEGEGYSIFHEETKGKKEKKQNEKRFLPGVVPFLSLLLLINTRSPPFLFHLSVPYFSLPRRCWVCLTYFSFVMGDTF